MQINHQVLNQQDNSRRLYPQLQTLCDFLNLGYGGFDGMVIGFDPNETPDSQSPKAIKANKGRSLYPQLQTLCDFLNSGKRPW
jgi:hypothetical protein